MPRAFQDPAADLAVGRIRITSYNVCYTKLLRLKAHGLLVDKAGRTNGVLLNHRDGGQIFLSQDVFEDLDAAQMLFEWIVSRFPRHSSFCSVAYLRRIRATSPKSGMMLPPDVV